MTERNYIDSYYRDTMVSPLDCSPLTEKVSVDVCVVGGGLAGLTAALELVRAGKSVALIEEKMVGWGASGRNAGFVADGYARDILELEDWLGADHARELFELSRMGTNYVRHTISSLSIGSAQLGEGWLRVSRRGNEDATMRYVEYVAEQYGATYSYLDKERVRSLLVSETYFHGIEDVDAFHIQPLNYALSLGKEILSRAGQIFEHCGARALVKDGAGWTVTVRNGGSVLAETVLLCGSAYMHDLYPKLERAVLPVATYIVTSERMPERLPSAIRYAGCIGDTRRAGDYYRLVENGERLLWGGRITTRQSEPKALAEMLKKDILSIYPQLGDFQIDYAWSGLMGYCLHKMPILRQMEEGIWVATGTGGHGLNTTATIGLVAAEGIAGISDRYRLFEPFRAHWGGGPIGRAGTQLVYWGLQAQDWWDEFRS